MFQKPIFVLHSDQVFYYSVSIFEKTGLSHSDAQWANLGAGCINLFIAGFSPLLMTKLNRRPLILWSCFISGLFLTILTFIVHYIVSMDFMWSDG